MHQPRGDHPRGPDPPAEQREGRRQLDHDRGGCSERPHPLETHAEPGEGRRCAPEEVEPRCGVRDVIAQRVAEHPVEAAVAELGDAGDHVGDHQHERRQRDRPAVPRRLAGRTSPSGCDRRRASSDHASAAGDSATINRYSTIRFSKCSSCPHDPRYDPSASIPIANSGPTMRNRHPRTNPTPASAVTTTVTSTTAADTGPSSRAARPTPSKPMRRSPSCRNTGSRMSR